MREIKNIGSWFVSGGAVTVTDVTKCADWTTCTHREIRHVHGTVTVAGPKVQQFHASTIARTVDEAVATLALMAAGFVAFN